QPAEYIGFSAVPGIRNPEYDSDKNRLTVRLRTDKAAFNGPPCPVELVLLPQNVPNLVPVKTAGVYKQTVADKEVVLIADNLKFTDETNRKALVYVSVDNYPRALGFTINMGRKVGTSTGEQLKPGARVRFVGDTIVPASPSYPARVEVDNAPSGLNLLEVGFDRDNDGRFDENEIKTLRGHREMHVRLPAFAPDGVLSFKTEVRDWSTTFD